MPFDTIHQKKYGSSLCCQRVSILTWYSATGTEDFCNFWIHFYSHFFLFHHLLIPLFDPLVSPLLKGFSNDCIYNIGYIGPGQLKDLFFHAGQSLESYSTLMLAREVEDILDRQMLIIRQLDDLHVITLYHLPLIVAEITQMPNCNRFLTW